MNILISLFCIVFIVFIVSLLIIDAIMCNICPDCSKKEWKYMTEKWNDLPFPDKEIRECVNCGCRQWYNDGYGNCDGAWSSYENNNN
jgi:hypothetical protein